MPKKQKKPQRALYRILPTDALTKQQREHIDTMIQQLATGDSASALAGKNGWSYLNRFLPGSVGILCYNGIEVAIFYKRQVIEVDSDPCDPIPAYKVEDPREAWVRTEFIHTRASTIRTKQVVGGREEELAEKIKHLEGLMKQKDIELEILRENERNAASKATRKTPQHSVRRPI